MEQQRLGVRLVQVNTTDSGNDPPDVDIIAVHGLDTQSPDTWIWRSKDGDKPDVNWLADSHMLPARAQRVRIFTCDWPADLFQDSASTEWTVQEFALCLLHGIQSMRQGDDQGKDRPILFIASCLGGIMLMKALVIADSPQSNYISIRKATCGIIFLATPFRGTSFQDVAAWVEPILKARALLRHQSVTQLLNIVKGSTSDLEELVSAFTQLCLDKDRPFQVHTFYEKVVTILQSKFLPSCLLPLFGQAKLLVDSSSAKLDIVKEPLALERRHVTMNKFFGPEDPEYDIVAGKILEFLEKIRETRPLEQADAWIREHHYTTDNLKIERLSGTKLPMDQCYINLALVEQVSHDTDSGGPKPQSSSFSLLARQKVETPDKSIQVELAMMFNQRKRRDGQEIQPRRILIRGRAGVGKTTLCKKIVYEFCQGAWSEWSKLFDRILWVPLRNLNLQERQEPGYNFECLFRHEYFSFPISRPDLARELSHELTTKSSKTLFLLDGLDEVSQDREGAMSRFLHELLKQPNVIITSRPSAKPPSHMDLELETIGFYPDQVDAYLDADHEIGPRANEVRSFLKEHWLIQGLMRIPIQLDALCYTWEDSDPLTMPGTMTGIYKAIEQKLWKKDAVTLGNISKGFARKARPLEIERTIETEIALLEYLAFNGMHSGIIEFTLEHQDKIVETKKFSGLRLPLGETLARLSFLRTSDSSSRAEKRSYHFIHLTFQEYFAARYFVRQWRAGNSRAGNSLECLFLESRTKVDIGPVKFLEKHKYTARYDILWRFVAGLLDAEKQEGPSFFHTIEKEPLDLLGPTHQRLVMHCLSEVSMDVPLRQRLEEKLMDWLLFECSFQKSSHFSREMEFPEPALRGALQKGSDDAKVMIVESLSRRPIMPPSFNELAPSFLRADASWDLKRDVFFVLKTSQTDLSDDVLAATVQRLGDEDWAVRNAALKVLQEQPSLSDKILTPIVRLVDEDEDSLVRKTALEVLEKQSSLPDEKLAVAVQRLDDENPDTRKAALRVLQAWPSLSNEIFTAVAQQLDDERSDIQESALKILRQQSSLSDDILIAVIRRLDDIDWKVQQAAETIIWGQSSLSDEILTTVVRRLSNGYRRVPKVLRSPHFSDKFLAATVQRLDHEYPDIQNAALEVLQTQSRLSSEILIAVVQKLDDESSRIQFNALEVLNKQSSLSDEIIMAVAPKLDDTDLHIQHAALRILWNQSSLSCEIITAVAQRLGDTNWSVRRGALEILQGQSSLSGEILRAVVQRLDDAHWEVRGAALEVLQKQSSLSYEILRTVVQRLDDAHWEVRGAALEVLQKQPSLSDDILTAVARQLESERGVCDLAEAVLRKYETFYSTLLSGSHVGALLKVLLHRAFEEQVSWYVEDGRSCVNIPDGVRSAKIENMEEFNDMVIKARPSGTSHIYRYEHEIRGLEG